MNIEDFRDYCLSLDNDVIEKTPFGKFAAARYDSILVFYTVGHMFCASSTSTISTASMSRLLLTRSTVSNWRIHLSKQTAEP